MMGGARITNWARTFERADAAIPDWLPETIPSAVPGLRTSLVVVAGLIAGIQVLFPTTGISGFAVAGVVILYTLSLMAALLIRVSPDRRVIVVGAALTLGLAGGLELTFASVLGTITFDILVLLLVYHLPARWALPLLVAGIVVFLVTVAAHKILLPQVSGADQDVQRSVIVPVVLVVVAAILRSRSMHIFRLQHTQDDLRREMANLRATQNRLEVETARTVQLAAVRERTRIARDMHDVLAHSLTMLSIQTQALRQVVTRDPQRAAQLLDELAEVVRESIDESRRVVGTLRAATESSDDCNSLEERLRSLAERFALRTGLRYTVEERGTPVSLNPPQEETLQYALQEALTNAARHGEADQVWVDVLWRSNEIILTVRNDGAVRAPVLAASNVGGHGLRGMGERVTGLGGTLRFGPQDEGFVVCVALPLLSPDIVREEA